MKKSFKILAVVLSLILVVGALPAIVCAALPAGSAKEKTLAFHEDGSFKILQIADIQDNQTLSPITVDYIQRTVMAEKPDLLVLTGDNIYGSSCHNPKNSEKAIRKVMEMLESLGVPTAITFGNHDDQSNNYSKEEQMAIYEEYAVNLAVVICNTCYLSIAFRQFTAGGRG